MIRNEYFIDGLKAENLNRFTINLPAQYFKKV